MTKSVQTSLRLHPDVMARLEAEANRQTIAVAAVIRKAINAYLDPTPAPVQVAVHQPGTAEALASIARQNQQIVNALTTPTGAIR